MSGNEYKDTDVSEVADITTPICNTLTSTPSERDERDELDEIWYSGTPQTKSNQKNKTANTQLLFDSEISGRPVRVLRSMHLSSDNRYKPKRGFRYDGLYTVKSHRLVDPQKQHYVFHLVRNGGQDPVRYQGLEQRPTEKEIATLDREMRMCGKKK
jgi:hypothetical protein